MIAITYFLAVRVILKYNVEHVAYLLPFGYRAFELNVQMII